VARFPGLPPHRQLTYQAKQTISREMEQEKMRRAEQLMQRRNPVAVRRQNGSQNMTVQTSDNQVNRRGFTLIYFCICVCVCGVERG